MSCTTSSSCSHLQSFNFQDGPFIITVVGNIGSGKTYLMGRIHQRLTELNIPCVMLPEPVDLWLKPYNFLKETEHQTPLKPIAQGYVFATMMNRFIPYINFEGVLLIERSVINGVHVFSRDETNPLVLHYYRELGKLEQQAGFDMMLNVDTDISVCLERITNRGRKGELESIPAAQYLETLDVRHRQFINLVEYCSPEKLVTVHNSKPFSDGIDADELITKLVSTILSRLPEDISDSEASSTDLSSSEASASQQLLGDDSTNAVRI